MKRNRDQNGLEKGGAMGSGWAQAGGAGTRGDKIGIEAGGHDGCGG